MHDYVPMIIESVEFSAQTIIDTIEAIKRVESLNNTEKSENLKKANDILRDIIKEKQCRKCQNVCDNLNSCEFCIRNYLVSRFEKWTSENEEIDEWIENIQYTSEDGMYHKMKALWTPFDERPTNLLSEEINRIRSCFYEKQEYVSKPNQGRKDIENIKYDQIEKEEFFDGIGRISFRTMSERRVAIKTLQINKLDKTKDRMNSLLSELLQQKISSRRDHELLGVAIKFLYRRMPFANNGNLRNYIKNNKLPFGEKLEVAKGIVNGIKVLHNNNIVHGNIVIPLIESRQYSYCIY
ncbi:kinase-like domain-containing protein [Rhizophagus clarus]|uniref:Kinase-like domain-containing protein n=1 Tax=Rhizophagus clarus TaxID=94130 RepID=A0A8H3MCL8_9GLOM|nr:kinase-like domain-containing protein [Rhizophagus clarus]